MKHAHSISQHSDSLIGLSFDDEENKGSMVFSNGSATFVWQLDKGTFLEIYKWLENLPF